MSADEFDRGPSRRQLARKERRDDGDQSARLARALMSLSVGALGRLALDDDLRREVDAARRITAMSARRREERRLAGVLRRLDADDLEARLAKVQQGGDADPRPFQQAEAWRARLLAEGADGLAALATFTSAHPGADRARLDRLLADAHRERTTGKPPGAARALFRFVLDALTAPAPDADADAPDADPA